MCLTIEAIIELVANKGIQEFINVSHGKSNLYQLMIVTAVTEKSEYIRHTNNSRFSAVFLSQLAKHELETQTPKSYIHT